MATKRFKPTRPVPSFKPKRKDVRMALWAVPILLLAGALLDPRLIGPIGPLGATEVVTTKFVPCSGGTAPACVIDGDTFRLGDRTIRITGIDAPEITQPLCPAEAQLGRRSADRLLQLLNQGPFDMVAHRLQTQDRHGRYLMVLRRNGDSIGAKLIAEDLAHRYTGFKISWC
jgi:endonuclease YncB( thermonuclease family)